MLNIKSPIISNAMTTFLYQISSFYHRATLSPCCECLLYPVYAIISIIKSVFARLRWLYEKTFYGQEQKEIRQLNRDYNQHKTAIKKAFFRLGAMSIEVKIQDMDDLLLKIDKYNTGSELFKTLESSASILKACQPYLEELNEEYFSGKRFFKIIQDVVKRCAKRQTHETKVTDSSELINLLSQEKNFSDTPEGKNHDELLAIIVHARFVCFKKFFHKNLPKDS